MHLSRARLAGVMHLAAASIAMLGQQAAIAACTLVSPAVQLEPYGDGRASTIQWTELDNVAALVVWARWQVPEGETVETFETQAMPGRVEIPASPAPWRPLKLLLQVKARCQDGSESPSITMTQLQYAEDSACPAVVDVRIEAGQVVTWKGGAGERFEVTWFHASSGQLHRREQVSAARVQAPIDRTGRLLMGVARTCGGERRSATAYHLLP